MMTQQKQNKNEENKELTSIEVILRDEFATAALQALLSKPDSTTKFKEEELARTCFKYADAMLKIREEIL